MEEKKKREGGEIVHVKQCFSRWEGGGGGGKKKKKKAVSAKFFSEFQARVGGTIWKRLDCSFYPGQRGKGKKSHAAPEIQHGQAGGKRKEVGPTNAFIFTFGEKEEKRKKGSCKPADPQKERAKTVIARQLPFKQNREKRGEKGIKGGGHVRMLPILPAALETLKKEKKNKSRARARGRKERRGN